MPAEPTAAPRKKTPRLTPLLPVFLGWAVLAVALALVWRGMRDARRAAEPEPLSATITALQDRLHEDRQALHHAARQAHLAGDPDAARELDGALKELYERHKAAVRDACRERGAEPPGWATD
jgi:hypothetical protein